MKVVFFGSIGVAKKILEQLIVLNQNIDLLGVVCEKELNNWRNDVSVYTYAKENNIPIFAIEDIPDLEPELGISVRFNKIISTSVIDAFKFGIVNTHGGILPEYRGSYCNINAILNKEKYFGVTLHYIFKGIDTGDIIDILLVPISENDTGFDLYLESERLCFDIVEKNLNNLLFNKVMKISQKQLISEGRNANTYRAKNTMKKKVISDNGIIENLHIVRAFDSPHHEPAYIMSDGSKIYLRVKY